MAIGLLDLLQCTDPLRNTGSIFSEAILVARILFDYRAP